MTEVVATSAAAPVRRRSRSRMLRHFLARPLTVGATVVLLLLLLGALFSPLIAPQNPYDLRQLDSSASLLPAVWETGGRMPYLLGTDVQGRDVLSTILYGSRTSFLVGFSVVILAGSVGASVGLITGFFGGVIDHLFMRIADSLLAFSTTLIAMLFLGLFKASSVLLVIGAISIVDWVQYARTMRGSVLSVKEEDYVQAARSLGASKSRIILRHILPNALSPLVVIAAVNFAVVVMLEATLSFLGVGVPITQPSLGMMISQGKDFIYAGMPHLILPPAITLMAIVFSLNLIGDWLREEIDPRAAKL
jgi:peptide/nickel transport system permease protein